MDLEDFSAGVHWPYPGWYLVGAPDWQDFDGRTNHIRWAWDACTEDDGIAHDFTATGKVTFGAITDVRVDGQPDDKGNGGFKLKDGATTQVTVAYVGNTTQTFQVFRGDRATGTLIGTSPVIALDGTPNNYLEWVVNIGDSVTVSLYHNNTLFWQITAVDTDVTGSGNVDSIQLFGSTSDIFSGYGYGDIYLLTDQGGALPERLGVCRVPLSYPTTTGGFVQTHNDWSESDVGLVNDWTIGAGLGWDSPTTTGQEQSASCNTNWTDLWPGDVMSVKTTFHVQETGDGTMDLDPGMVSGTTTVYGTTHSPALSPGSDAMQYRSDTDPDTAAAWTRAAAQAVEGAVRTQV